MREKIIYEDYYRPNISNETEITNTEYYNFDGVLIKLKVQDDQSKYG